MVEGTIRKVLPYYHQYATPFKERWRHRVVSLVLCTELGQLPSVVARAIDSGDIYVTTNNGKAVPTEKIAGAALKSHRLQPHDMIHNRQHIHEPSIDLGGLQLGASKTRSVDSSPADPVSDVSPYPVSDPPPQPVPTNIIFEDETILVVNKPPGVPTHPSGIYRYNTITEIVRTHRGQVWPCHRLDKATLGVLVLAKTKACCTEYMKLMGAKSMVDKLYLARVRGQFPENLFQYTFPVFTINSSGGYAPVPNVPLDCTTLFRRVQYLPRTNESIVLCKPITGKMHQIRIHLRNLGFPISNDPYYNDSDHVNSRRSALEMAIHARVSEHHPALGVLPLPTLSASSGLLLPSHSFAGANLQPAASAGPADLAPAVLAAMHDLVLAPVTSFDGLLSLQQYLDDFAGQIKDIAALRAHKDTILHPTLCTECARPTYESKPDSGIFLHALMLREKSGAFLFLAHYPPWALVSA